MATLFATTPSLAAADAYCIERAQKILSALDRGDFAAARLDFDAKMQSALSEGKLREVWTALPQQLGPLDRRAEAVVRREGDAVIGAVPLHFGMGWFELQVTCAADGKVSGFWIKPAAQAPTDAAADYFPLPDYAQADRYNERPLQIDAGSKALPATLTMPKEKQPVAAVVLVHGSGAHDADETIGPNKPFRDLALGLASHGIAVLRYVKRTAAHPDRFAPGHTFTVDDETVDDALIALQLLRRQAGVDPARTFVLGHSLGAMMAPRIEQRDPAVAGLILLAAPAEALEDMVVRQASYLLGASDAGSLATLAKQRDEIKQLGANHPPAAPMMLNLPASYWKDLKAYDPIAIAKRAQSPMLILQGGRDYQVTPADDFARWQSAFAGNPRVELKMYPTLSHLFMAGGDPPGPKDYRHASHVDAGVIADIADWIVRQATATHS